METLVVRHVTGDRFAIDVREHRVIVDQPVSLGGEDTAPTPTELFVAGLVSCVAFYARRYLARHSLPEEGLEVTGEFSFDSRPARVDAIRLQITLPEGVPADRREPLLKVASHCTVHNTLRQPPHVEIGFAPERTEREGVR
jgi:uncharacterized OsmC-like protein